MAYIGAEPVPGQNREIDDISSGFNGSATAFTLQVSSTNVSPESANNILVNLGGVMQNPGTDYTIAASTITFTTAPASGLSFWALILGAGINTATVADDTIGSSKLVDTAVTAGSYTTADITVDAQGRITAAANGTIAEAEIANNAVTTNKIADEAVTLAKLPHGTSSNNGKFLRANNGADPTFETVTGTTINTNADNRVITGSGTANTLNGEANLTFDGTLLKLQCDSGEFRVEAANGVDAFSVDSDNGNTIIGGSGTLTIPDTIVHTGDTDTKVRFPANDNISFEAGGTERLRIDNVSGSLVTAKGTTDANLRIENSTQASSQSCKLDMSPAGSASGVQLIATSDEDFSTGANRTAHFRIDIRKDGTFSERLRITNDGKVGIGTTNAQSSMHLKSMSGVLSVDSYPQLTIETSATDGAAHKGGGILFLNHDGTGGSFGGSIQSLKENSTSGNTAHYMRFSTRAAGGSVTERMRIGSDGHIGVGDSATSPAHDIHIRNNKFADLQIENIANTGESALTLLGKTSGGTVRTFMLKYDAGDNVRIATPSPIHMNFETSDQLRMKISSGGNIGAPSGSNIYNVSDSRLKKNIVTLDKGLTSINALRPVSFNWIDGFCDEEKDTLYGFIAQEVKTVDTNLVQQFGFDGSVEVNGQVIEDTIRVNEKFVIPMLVKAVQELSAQVTTLEAEKTKLQTDLTALTARVAVLESA